MGVIFQNGLGVEPLKIYTVGETALGGIIAYINGGGSTGTSGLVVTVSDLSTNAQWGCEGTVIGGTSSTIDSGLANTIAITTGCPTGGIAAELCIALVEGGYSDWYLPSKDELNALYINKNTIGGFTSYFYWTSTEFDAGLAWKQFFNNTGDQDYDYKGNPSAACYVRAVRKF
jgi:hypothetical protein